MSENPVPEIPDSPRHEFCHTASFFDNDLFHKILRVSIWHRNWTLCGRQTTKNGTLRTPGSGSKNQDSCVRNRPYPWLTGCWMTGEWMTGSTTRMTGDWRKFTATFYDSWSPDGMRGIKSFLSLRCSTEGIQNSAALFAATVLFIETSPPHSAVCAMGWQHQTNDRRPNEVHCCPCGGGLADIHRGGRLPFHWLWLLFQKIKLNPPNVLEKFIEFTRNLSKFTGFSLFSEKAVNERAVGRLYETYSSTPVFWSRVR